MEYRTGEGDKRTTWKGKGKERNIEKSDPSDLRVTK